MTVSPTINSSSGPGGVYDVLANPFVVLNVPMDASKEDVVTAFDDGLADNSADEDALRDARKQLLAPKLRLQATVEFFPDASQVEREEAINALRQNRPMSELLAIAKTLPSFSRTIFLAQIAQTKPSSGVLRLFALSRAQVDRDAIAETVAEYLTTSGSPRPPDDAIVEVIEAVTIKCAERLFERYDDARSAAVDMTRCVQEELPRAAGEQVSALGVVVDAYVRVVTPTLQANRRKVEEAADAIRKDPDVARGVETLVDALTKWDEIAQPQQLLASHKGRDEGAARDLYQYLRSLMLDLANEKEKPSIALAINKASRAVFAELPRAEQQLKDDQTSLEELADQERLHELSTFVMNAKKNPDLLVRDLNKGFGPSSKGNAGRLYDIFNRSLAMTEGTEAVKYVWGFVRVLALELNNELGEQTASLQLVEGLYAHSRFREAPAETRARIEEDLATARSNAVHRKLSQAVQAKDRTQIRSYLAELVSITKDPAERAQYQQMIAQFDAANRARMIKWAVWAVIGLVVVGFMSMQGSRGTSYSTRTTPTYSTPPVVRPASTLETKPPVGKGLDFSRENIRYCLYQSARLDAAKTLLATEQRDGVIDAFNEQVDDYNTRCASYRYYEADMSAVQAEVATKASALSAEGSRMVLTWRARL